MRLLFVGYSPVHIALKKHTTICKHLLIVTLLNLPTLHRNKLDYL